MTNLKDPGGYEARFTGCQRSYDLHLPLQRRRDRPEPTTEKFPQTTIVGALPNSLKDDDWLLSCETPTFWRACFLDERFIANALIDPEIIMVSG